SIYADLDKQINSVFKIIPTKVTMDEACMFIESARETSLAKRNQIITMIVDIKDYSLNGNKLAALEKKEKRLSLYQELLDYSRIYQASVFSSADGDEFILLITKGIFQDYTNFYEDIPIVTEITNKFSISINMNRGMKTK